MRNPTAFALLAALAMSAWAAPAPKLTLNFEHTEAGKVLDEIARLWGRPIRVDPWVRGKVSIQVQDLEADETVRRVLAQLSMPAVFSEETMSVSLQTKGRIRTDVSSSRDPVQTGPFEFIPPPSGAPPAPSDKVTLDFEGTDVTVVLAEIAQQLGRTLDLDPWVRGKVTVHVQSSDPQRALTQILSQLPLPSSVWIGRDLKVALDTDSNSLDGVPHSCSLPANIQLPLTFSVKPGQVP